MSIGHGNRLEGATQIDTFVMLAHLYMSSKRNAFEFLSFKVFEVHRVGLFDDLPPKSHMSLTAR